jgi:hypothetical protein
MNLPYPDQALSREPEQAHCLPAAAVHCYQLPSGRGSQRLTAILPHGHIVVDTHAATARQVEPVSTVKVMPDCQASSFRSIT